MYLNASPAPDKCILTLLRPWKVCKNIYPEPKGIHKYFLGFSSAGEVFIYIVYLSDTYPAPDMPKKYTDKPRKYLCTPFRRGDVFMHTSP